MWATNIHRQDYPLRPFRHPSDIPDMSLIVTSSPWLKTLSRLSQQTTLAYPLMLKIGSGKYWSSNLCNTYIYYLYIYIYIINMMQYNKKLFIDDLSGWQIVVIPNWPWWSSYKPSFMVRSWWGLSNCPDKKLANFRQSASPPVQKLIFPIYVPSFEPFRWSPGCQWLEIQESKRAWSNKFEPMPPDFGHSTYLVPFSWAVSKTCGSWTFSDGIHWYPL